VNAVLLALLIGALLLIQALIGGTRLVFSFPSYGLLALAAVLSVARRPVGRPQWLCFAGTVLMAGYVVGRAAFSPVAYLTLSDVYMVLACLATYLLVTLHLQSRRLLGWLFGALLLMALAHVTLGFWQFARGGDFMLFGLKRPPGGHRASGFFISPNHLAGYLEVVGVMALSFTVWSDCRGWVRALLGYCGLLCFAGLAVTGSRGGYLSALVALAVFGFLSLSVVHAVDRRRAMFLGVAGSFALLLLSGGLLSLMSQSLVLQDRMERLGEQFNGSRFDFRIYNWQAALDQWKLSPWTGTGAGTHLYFGRIFRRPEIQSDPVHAHCDYLELLAEYGVAGAACVFFFVAAHVRAGLRHLGEAVEMEVRATGYLRHDQVALYIGALSAVAAYLAHSVVDFNLHIPGNALLLSLVFALLGGLRAAPLAPAASPGLSGGETWPLRLALPLLGGWLGWGGWAKLPNEYWTEKMRQALVARKFDETIALAGKAGQSQRNPETYFYLGEANRSIGDSIRLRSIRAPHYAAAVEWYRRALAIFPQDDVTWLRLAESYDALRRFPEADTAYLTALRLDPNLGILYAFYAADLRRRGHPEVAEELSRIAQNLALRDLRRVGEKPLDSPREIATPP
jgi:O-antigen ligase